MPRPTDKKPAAKKTIKVETVTHKDQRTNIPTEELRGFVAEDEKTPKALLYPRDPSLDPQLVWKGKDEQDSKDLAVDVVPIYIQEKIHPQALIEDLRAHSKGNTETRPQMAMFADFNGIKFEDYIDFYKHGQKWQNRMILGDSLLVMASLAEKEAMKGKVQMVFMDPPYGIRFNSNWQVSTRRRDVFDGKRDHITRQPEQIRAFRDTWELGIHSYLAYARDRMILARDLLSETGSIFLQIGDENVHLLRSVLDEVFGSRNFVSFITFRKTAGATADFLPGTADYLLWYAKDIEQVKYRQINRPREVGGQGGEAYSSIELADGTRRRMTSEDQKKAASDSDGARAFRYQILTSPRIREARTGYFPIEFEDRSFLPSSGEWKTHRIGIQRLIKARRVDRTGNSLNYIRYHSDFPAFPLTNTWEDTQSGSGMEKVYVVQTNPKVIERCILMSSDPGDLILDPTCGSGTTAFVAEQLGRRWITTDTSRVALALARTRLMAGRFTYYVLADSPEGIQKEAELTGTVPDRSGKTESDVKKGFVYKRIPHITLKSIAQNDEIDVIYAQHQEKLEQIREKLNKIAKQKWEDWQIPREADAKWPAEMKKLHGEWWTVRRDRQKAIDDSIARRAETEFLYDQPYEDSKRIRVTGPFTVESLSPHRVLAPDTERPATEAAGERDDAGGSFVNIVLDNLRKAGVQNTVKQERLVFDRLEPYSGLYLQASGEYTPEGGKSQRVAICIGPQYGTVGPDLVNEAAKEAVQGLGFNLLIVLGFAFDPHTSEEQKRYGRLQVLVAKMNPDLLMGEELLKKTGAGNLFMVFGEPDVDIRPVGADQIEVEIRGLDVYDPTTQEIRSRTTDDIACWFIDTDYNGESFFVRHAYFTGADEPYEKLKRALRADIDESAWSALYSTVSRPFPKPKGRGKASGKIAIKVINHYGDEVLKVYTVA
jgi:adenine-specific DNA-methyltransferase